MLFLVPDNDSDIGNSAPPPDDLFEQAVSSVNKEEQPKDAESPAAPASSSASPTAPSTSDDQQKTARKVQLDLDDAPFLEKEEEKPEEPPEKEAPVEMPKPAKAEPEPDPNDKKKSRKKKLIMIAGGVVLLIIIGLGAKMFLSGSDGPADEPVKTDPADEGPIVQVVPSTPPIPDAPKGPAFTITMDPFWIEQRGPEGEIRFLLCQFSIPVDDQNLNDEILARTLLIRDALYYYLKNRPIIFLTGAEVMDELKADVAGIINENIGAGKVEDIFIEEYRVSGP